MKNMLFVLPAIVIGTFSLTIPAPAQQAPAAPLVPGKLYYVPGQLFPINSATGKIQLPPEMQAKFDRGNQSATLSSQGNYEAGKGNWAKAVSLYRQAISLDPADAGALYGLGDYSLTKNDLQAAVGYYRQAIYNYTDAKPPDLLPFGEPNAYRVMEYAILLSETGQTDEAIRVYNHGAYLSNYMDGRPRPRLPLPEFGTETGQLAYTPEHLQALAAVGWAVDHVDFDREGAKARMKEAAALYPDSPVPYFFRARLGLRLGRKTEEMAADYDKAQQLGGGAADEFVERDRKMFHLPAAGQKP